MGPIAGLLAALMTPQPLISPVSSLTLSTRHRHAENRTPTAIRHSILAFSHAIFPELS
jgi:hypothetical protein